MSKEITNVSIDVLKAHPRNLEFFDDISGDEYEKFKKSIQEEGIISEIIVDPAITVSKVNTITKINPISINTDKISAPNNLEKVELWGRN